MVYIIQEMPGKNITSASKYGELKLLLKAGDQVYLDPDAYTDKMIEKLKDYSDRDYLLLMGDPALIGIACGIAAMVNEGRINVLKWDRQTSSYNSININVGGVLDDRK